MRHGTPESMTTPPPTPSDDSREVVTGAQAPLDADPRNQPEQVDQTGQATLDTAGSEEFTSPPRTGDPFAKITFLEKVHQDWAAPRLLDHIASQQERIKTSLSFTNQVAFIGSSGLAKALANYVELLHPRPVDGWVEALPAQSLVLIEGRWLEPGHPWRAAILGASPDATRPLYSFLQSVRRQGVPIALWLTEEAGTKPIFAHLFPYVDRIFVAAAADQDADATYLPPAVDIKRFNPFKDDIKIYRRTSRALSHVMDGAHEYAQLYSKEESYSLIEPLLGYKSWLIDSTYNQRNNNVRLSSALRRRFLGCFLDSGLPFLLRQATSLFLPGAMMRGRPVHSLQRTLEAAASKSVILTDGLPLEGLSSADTSFPGLLPHLEGERLRSVLERLSRDVVATMALQHVAWREAATFHTYFERLQVLFATLGIEAQTSQALEPSVNVVMPTIRPELVPAAISTFSRLTYPHKHFTIVLNGVSLPPDLLDRIDAREDITLHTVPGYKSIGYCMNTGIDSRESAYWAKFDDDDVYGPEYLSDLMLQRKYIDFDITGKASLFNYFEDIDAMQIRSPDMIDAEYTFLGGGTFISKNPGRYFPQDVRGYADTLFALNAIERGDLLIAGDPFNFVQVRRSDSASHTWTLGASRVNRQGPTRTGLRFDHVII